MIGKYVSVVVLDDDWSVIAAGICDSQETVNEWLHAFVRKWWLKEIGTPLPDPITDSDMEQFFNATMESYSISGSLPHTTMENVNDLQTEAKVSRTLRHTLPVLHEQ